MKRRNARWDGVDFTSKSIANVLDDFETRLKSQVNISIREIRHVWSQIVDRRYQDITYVECIKAGCVKIHVTDSIVYSILQTQEKARLLQKLKNCLPNSGIRDLKFIVKRQTHR